MGHATHWRQRGLYLLTPDTEDTAGLCRDVAAALRAGTVLLQYRNKAAAAARRQEQACALLSLCREHGVPLVINDDVELAARIGADGVHLGVNDGPLIDARQRLGPEAIIGVSCYDDPQRARSAAAGGASYIAFGAFFPSPTKPQARRATTTLLAATSGLQVPKVAIGGITADNARPLIEAGADLLAVISAVFHSGDIAAAVHRFTRLFQE